MDLKKLSGPVLVRVENDTLVWEEDCCRCGTRLNSDDLNYDRAGDPFCDKCVGLRTRFICAEFRGMIVSCAPKKG